MANNPRHSPPKSFDIHRTLPTHPHRTPSTSRHAPTDIQEPEEVPVRKRRSIWKRLLIIFVLVVLVFFIGIVGLGVWDGRNISSASRKMFGSSNLVSLVRGGSLKTCSNGRVNVLLVGYSVDDPGHQGATLTDSILLLSMNPTKHTGFLLSIPRDLYVQIPGNGYGKINEVYQDGGISLLEQVVNSDFDTQINYYALLDYAAVRDTVNALGGITINIQSPDSRGLYDPNISKADGGPLLLKNGLQTVNGQTALNLTRARGDAYGSYGFPRSDFDRTGHQRQVFTAIKDKLNWKLVLNPRKNSRILNAMATNIKTDVPINNVRPLFGLFNSIPNAKLQSLSLNNFNGADLLQSYTTYYGQSALVPSAGPTDFSQINSAIQNLNN